MAAALGVMIGYLLPHGGPTASESERQLTVVQPPPAMLPQAPPNRGGDWRAAFAQGQRLASQNPEQAWAYLQANWSRLESVDARQQMLKAFAFHPNHPRLLDVLDLGMNDSEPQVRQWAAGYLREIAFQDFAEDSSAYKAWRQQTAGKPLEEVTAASASAWVKRMADASGARLPVEARFANFAARGLEHHPLAQQAAVQAGVLDLAARWLAEHGDNRDVVRGACAILRAVRPDEAYLRRVILPLTQKGNPTELRMAAVNLLGQKGNDWAVEPLMELLRQSLSDRKDRRTIMWAAAGALGEIGDPRVIPAMIAVIGADNTYDTVYGVGYFGLGKLTGVRYDESHDGAWWRDWWQRERQNYPENVRSLEIPQL